MSRHKRHARQESEEDGLLVFGYSSRIYSNDSRSELIAGESHLQPWSMDESVLIDRFDVRLLLSTVPSESRGNGESNGAHEKEERECEDERWKDLHDAELASLKRMDEDEVEVRPKKAEYAFTYDQPSVAPPSSSKIEEEEEEEDDSEDEPFIPPSGIKLPLGLETPGNQKLNHVIERTAVFVVKQGAQMEIVIKAKQRTNQEQFGFLHFDHSLNPYYKYIMKLIREGKYTPDLESKKKKKIVSNGTIEKEDGKGSNRDRKGAGNALTALMAQHGSDSESDSDCELHPSLLAGSRRGDSPDPVERGVKSFSGPMKKPMSPPPKMIRSDYRIETANDAYSTLFKNLAQINVQREKDQEEVERAERREERKEIDEKPIEREEESEESKREWEDFTDWFISFYGMSPPLPFCNMPYIPPPPDIEQALAGYARYVGENGAEAEFALKGRVELQLHFLTPSNPHHLYYLSAVRRAQWEKKEKEQRENNEVMTKAVVPPPPPLNRKQRRMAFMDAPQVSTAPLPSVIDPTALLLASAAPHSYETSMVKSASSPVLSASSPSYSYSSPHPMSPAPPPPPSSLAASSEGDIHSGLTLLPCPVPPNISSLAASQIAKPMEIMTERQLKARLFMEKILNDKRKKKEEETTKGVEGMEEGEIVESEEKEGRRGRRDGRETREDREERKEKEKERKDEKGEKKTVSASFFDDLIKSKMNALLKETVPGSLAVEKKNEEIKESKRAEDEKEKEKKGERRGGRDKKDEKREKEREERKRKREKKDKKEKKRRSRSRSSSCDERRRRRRRSRSASCDLPSKYRRR